MLLGIDLGTSSVKAVVAHPDGTVATQATAGYAVHTPHPGWSETAPQDWLTATTTAVRDAVARSGGEPVAVGFSGQMHGVVATGTDGEALRPAMLWSDSRAADRLDDYRKLPPPVRARLANPLSPGMAGPMLAWLAGAEPRTWARTRWALQAKDWVRAQLTGEYATEPSDASATLLYDVAADRWDDDVVGALGLDRDRLAPILASSGTRAGRLSAGAAARLGLPAGIPVAAGAADTAAAALGSGLTEPDVVQLTIGTGAQIVRPVTTLPHPLPDRPVTHLYRSARPAGWYAMAAVLNGGLTLGWVARTLGASWPELYATAARPPRPDSPYFLPHLHGERTPYLDPALRGAWIGLGPQHDREDLLRAALEGVAFALREALACIGAPAAPLRLAGGGTTDPAWRQMLADVLDRPVAPVEVAAASGLGAALLGAEAAGLPTTVRPVTAVVAAEPRPARTDQYRERFPAFRHHVQALRPSLHTER